MDNDIIDSGKIGILFRDDARGKDFWANRNIISNNRILNSGDEKGVAIKLDGQTKDTHVFGNVIKESHGLAKRIGIEVSAEVGNVRMEDNKIEGVSRNVIDNRK